MKKLLVSLFFTLVLQQNYACDICGCSSGNYFLGPVPTFQKYFVGIRYTFRHYKSVLTTDDTQFSNDFYQTAEIWGGYKFNEKFQILAFVPFNFNHSITDDGTRNNNGIGDVTAVLNYTLFNNKSITQKEEVVSHQLSLGFGIKAPTGKFQLDESELISSTNHQAGTGSLDFLLTSAYNLNFGNWGMANTGTYKINSAASDFKFGNRLVVSTILYRSFGNRNFQYSPNVGISYQYQNANQLKSTEIQATGGFALLGTIGIETHLNKITLGINAQLPMSQNISDGQTKIKLHSMAHISFAF